MSHSRSLVAILVAMQWANEDVFNSGSDIILVMLYSYIGWGEEMLCGDQKQSRGNSRRKKGGRRRAQMIDGSFRCFLQPCVPCYIKCIHVAPTYPTHTTCTGIDIHTFTMPSIHVVAVRKLIHGPVVVLLH